MQNKMKNIAIIGGGIFGATCAIILGKKCKITLFERHNGLLQEASLANQYRHHMGYHYPRDPETVRQIQNDEKSFREIYGQTIVKNIASYYSVAKTDSLTGPDDFIKFCKRFRLSYEVAYPDPVFLNRSSMAVCLKTPESIYDYQKLKSFIERRIRENKNISLKLNHNIIGGRIEKTGGKILKVSRKGGKSEQKFDCVINATYANRNRFCKWLGFPLQPLKLRFKEVVLVRLPTKKKLAVSVMDGPFATYVPTAKSGIFTFGDVPLSIHKTKLGELPDENAWFKRAKTRWPKMKKRCLKWMPILKDAKYIKSMFVVLPVFPEEDETRGRPTEVTYHGYGCWSILSGKIISCVSAAKKILKDIERVNLAC